MPIRCVQPTRPMPETLSIVRTRVPAKMVNDTLELARQDGAMIRRKPNEIFDNSFVENLEKSGFLKELWGGTVPDGGKRQ